MAYPPRLFENGSFYHIYNRGNRKQQIFLSSRDYERFLGKIIEYKKKINVNIIAFCLMPNHFHFLIQQLSINAISKFFSDLCNSYSKYFNTKYETVGSLYQGRFKAKLIDSDEYLIHVSRYIHLNPIDLFFPSKNIVNDLLNYEWSSLKSYLSSSKNETIDTDIILNYFSKKNPVDEYRKFIVSNINVPAYPIIEHLVFDE
ncbi:MAG: transposase [Candidatus Portnoybacteria bacterium CG10_big_fil_rev_8_21_14_0_10_36_7]|uniref:Transposase n=1 Tax=Candidatus Portnoybacteria bacterium CG10_big_fil_rev_8_21_14_0_10_36_7 TaxID=1974812 RepID=A0A2M8KDH9_9BACT|nr:MAG: transposase [Candidatus Portnoybacteria bacterium CG10_big_fil_rev_8_21_14_0_10_36_7]